MLDFMDYIQASFLHNTKWDRDNSYGSLTSTARSLLDFRIPRGLSLSLSSLSSPNSASLYSLSNSESVDGSLSYLYSSVPLNIPSKSALIPLRHLITGYRQLQALRRPDEGWWWEEWRGGRRIDRKATLLYGRLYLPTSLLEALYIRRISPTLQLRVSVVSASSLRSGGSILMLLSRDTGKHSTEYLFSTDSALLGVRGLYNFGPNLEHEDGLVERYQSAKAVPEDKEQSIADAASGAFSPFDAPIPLAKQTTSAAERLSSLNGRISVGAEVYYGLLNKSGGLSTGIRFATLPRHTGFPYTMTLTLNPLMGSLNSTYAVKAGPLLSLCTSFDFNFYSYESEWQVGMELWRRKMTPPIDSGSEWAKKKIRESQVRGSDGDAVTKAKPETSSLFSETGLKDEDTAGVLKARLSQEGAVSLLWEGRVKELLYSLGANIDFRKGDRIVRGVGLELQYSS